MDFKQFLNILQTYINVQPLTLIILDYLYDQKKMLISTLMKQPISFEMHNKLITMKYVKLSKHIYVITTTTTTNKICNLTKCNYTGKNFNRLWMDIRAKKFQRFNIIGQEKFQRFNNIGQDYTTFEDNLLSFLFICHHRA